MGGAGIKPVFTGNQIIEPVSAGEIVAVKPVLAQNTAGNIASQGAEAVNVDRSAFIQLSETAAQCIQGDVNSMGNMAILKLILIAHIQKDNIPAGKQVL